jgi:predicted RNase H-like HicB family nuclease
VTELTASNFPNLDLRFPISARVTRSDEMDCFLAMDYVFNWHGQGDSVQEALQELADVIAEDYEDLRSWSGELSKPLQERLNMMKRYFEDAR